MTDDVSLGSLPLAHSHLPVAGPRWLREMRERALARFNELGLPTIKNEEWKYTSLRLISETPLSLTLEDEAPNGRGDVGSVGLAGIDGPRLVFINGRFSREFSSPRNEFPEGVIAVPLLEAIDSHEGIVREHFNRHVRADEDAFASLNAAFLEHGSFIHIHKDARIDEPIVLLNIIATASERPLLVNPRTLVIVEDGAQATVVEDYVCLGGQDSVYLTNAVTEFVVSANAEAHHYMIERESRGAFNISTLAVNQARDSRFSSHTALFGGRIVRNNVNPVIDGENVYSMLNGLYVGMGEQHHDSHMRVEHRKPNCGSRQYYKGILADHSRGVFTGRIIVSPGAQKTDAVQSNQNLLLSGEAQAQTRPQLEIYADDVKCTHGATVGQLNEDAMFYLRSRGLPDEAARALLVYAFAGESLERMENEAIRSAVRNLLLHKLPDSRMLADVVGE
jgi:Fe-S cluster assembly protein SufD